MSLAFHHLNHSYGNTRVLQDISLSTAQGEILCLLGPSGGGKSTLLRLAAGLEPLQSGSITLGDQLLAEPGNEPPPEARPVGLVFQDHVLFPHLSVTDNIAFGLAQPKGRLARERVATLLAQMELDDLGQRFPHELSGGQQQRVALARALAPQPSVMLLDEPFASVDSTLRRELRQTTRNVLQAAGTTAIVVTHDPEEAMQLADSIAVMADGRIAQHAEPATIWRAPATLDVALLFGEAQAISGHQSNGQVTTEFGTLASDLPDGPVSVAVRPQGIKLHAGTETREPTATVTDVRLLGTHWQVRLQSTTSSALRANALVGNLEGISVGMTLATSLDQTEAFIFAAH